MPSDKRSELDLESLPWITHGYGLELALKPGRERYQILRHSWANFAGGLTRMNYAPVASGLASKETAAEWAARYCERHPGCLTSEQAQAKHDAWIAEQIEATHHA